ncbi:phage antirepressor [Microbacterium sp. USHLN272]|uniref:phage antirepressor n=1 Tax=Microbacterium sp. USHLN272 TaxID=3081287 RepID=UPI003017871A
MSALEVFNFDGADVRTIVINGDPWFVAADVARILGYRDAANFTRRLEDDEKGTHLVSTPGGAQNVTIVSESGLYVAVIGSQLDSARDFKRWVTRDVIPAIRRTGTYAPAPALSEDEIVHRALAITARRVEVLETRVAELEPVAAHAETFRQADGLRTIGDLANDFKAHCAERFPGVKVRHQDVFDHAGRLGIIIRTASVRHNQPTAQAIEAGWARGHRTTYGTNTRGQQTAVSTRLTPRGEARLWDGLAAWLGAHGTLAIPN